MKKLYVYQLWYDYSKNEYMFQMDYFYVEDKETYYKPIDLPEKPCITRSEIQKKQIGIIHHWMYETIFLEEPDCEKAKEIFLQMINKIIRDLMHRMSRYEEMKMAVEDFKQEECEDYDTFNAGENC